MIPLKVADKARLDTLYEDLCRYTWPDLPKTVWVPEGGNPDAVFLRDESDPLKPEHIAQIVTDSTNTLPYRYLMLQHYEPVLREVLERRRAQESGSEENPS